MNAPATAAQATASRLRVVHTVCRHGKPLATVDGLPGAGAELRPAELRAWAAALLAAATDCEALPIRRGHRRCERDYYALHRATTGAEA